MCDGKFKLELVNSSIFTPNTQGVGPGRINPNGSLIFSVHTQNASPFATPGQPEATIFTNTNGNINTISTLPIEAPFISVESQSATSDLGLVFVGDLQPAADPTTGPPVAGRIRVFRAPNYFDAAPVATRTFNDVAAFASFFLGQISPDNRYLGLTYAVTLSSDPNVATRSVLRILDTTTLADVVPPINYSGESNNVLLFQLWNECRKRAETYVAITPNGLSVLDFGNDFNFNCPSSLQVYRLDRNRLTLVAQTSLPQFARATSIPKLDCIPTSIPIAVATRLAVGSETSVFTDISRNPTCPGAGGSEEARVYCFNGNDLELIAAQNFNTDLQAITWYPNSNKLAIFQRGATGGQANVFGIYELVRNKNRCVGPKFCLKFISNTPLIAPPFDFAPEFSANGEWLVIIGADPDNQTSGSINNFNLYRVVNLKGCQ